MDFFKENKTMWIGIAVMVAVFGIYIGFFRGEGSSDSLLTSQSAVSGTEAGGDLVAILLELRSLELDPAIFSSSSFQALQDFSVELVPEPTGRRNPFAPIGAAEDFENTDTLDQLLEEDFSDLENLDI